MRRLLLSIRFLFFAFLLLTSWQTKAVVLFSDDFTSGSFVTNGWLFPNGQSNWQVGAGYVPAGATSPSAYFNWAPTQTNYTFDMATPVLNATSFAGGGVFLSLLLYYNNYSTATLEQFAIEYKSTTQTTWNVLYGYTNTGGTFNQTIQNVLLPGMGGQNFQVRFRVFGPNSFNINGWAVDNINIVALNPCSGQPVGGTTVSDVPSPCLGQNFTLSLTGNTQAGNMQYQWISSTTGNAGTWVPVTGATGQTYSTSLTTNMCFRCVVTCPTSSLFDTSSSICINPGLFSPYSSCYCPCTNTGTACITNVTFGSLNYSSTGCTGTSNYNFFTPPTVTIPNLIAGQAYNFSMLTDASAITSVWIDFDHSASFTPNEWKQVYITGTTGTVLDTIPFTSAIGQTRMRVRSRLPGNQNGANDACLAMGSGETEDYIVNILPAAPYDPAVMTLNTPAGNCFSATSTFSTVITNYGQNPINLSTNPVTVTLTVVGPNGTNNYTGTISSGTMSAGGANTYTVVIPGVNLYSGGLYTCNTSLTIGNAGGVTNGVLQDDSLTSPITLQNYRPTPGPRYDLCQYSSIPTGQGLSVSGCATPILDSVIVNFTLANSGNIPCTPAVNSTTYAGACLFATGTIPVLPNPTIQSATLTVTNLASANSGFALETRFPFFRGTVPTGTILWPSLQGNAGATVANYTWFNNIPVTTMGAIYDSVINTTSGVLKLGYNSTWSPQGSLGPGFNQNSGGQPTTVKLKIIYTYVPNNYVWYEAPAGGTSVYNSTPFDPLSVTNTVVNNSTTPGDYIFYVACGPSPNCRARDTLRINAAPVANTVPVSGCEDAPSSNQSSFNLTALNNLVSPNTSMAVSYYFDPGNFLPVTTPSANVSGSSDVYAVVTNPTTMCSTHAIVHQVVDTLPILYAVSSPQICAPASLNAASLINSSFSTIPSTPSASTFSYFSNQACTTPYPNPSAITSAGSVWIVCTSAANPACKDTIEGIINISTASNNIVNQAFFGSFTYSNSTMTNPINTTYGTYADGQTNNVYTTSCEKVINITDAANGISLGNVAVDVFIPDTVPLHNGQPYIKRHFHIEPTNQDSATVCLYLLQQDFEEYNDYASNNGWPIISSPTPNTTNLAISKVDNGDLNTPGHTVVVIPPTAINSSYDAVTEIWTLCFHVDSFSYFYLHAQNPSNGALGVTWKNFTGKRVENTSVLNWTSSMEKNCDYYVVERSRDAKSFSTISNRINSKASNGNSSTELSYDYTDKVPNEGHNYYRILQVDRDGKENMSRTVDVYFGNDTKVTVYPNPSHHEFNVEVLVNKATKAHLTLMDETGRTVKAIDTELTIGTNTVQLNIDDLADGVYMLKLSNDKGLNYTQPVRKY